MTYPKLNIGWIEKSAKRYRWRERVGGKVQTIATFDTVDEIVEMDKAERDLRESGEGGDRSLATVGAHFFEARPYPLSEKTWRGYQGQWNRHVRDSWLGRMDATRIKAEHVQKLLIEVSATPGGRSAHAGETVAFKVVLNTRDALSAVFRYMEDIDTAPVRVSANPVLQVEKKKLKSKCLSTRKETSEARSLTPSQVYGLLMLPQLSLQRLTALVVAIVGGLRLDNISTLEWADWRFDGDEWTLRVEHETEAVYRAKKRAGKVATVGGVPRRRKTLKYAQDDRKNYTVIFPDWAARVVNHYRELGGTAMSGLMFVNEHAQRPRPLGPEWDAGWADYIRPKLDEWAPGLGVPFGFRFHEMRSTCATGWLFGFWGPEQDVMWVKRQLNHKHVATTEGYLRSPDHEERKRWAREADGLAWGRIGVPQGVPQGRPKKARSRRKAS